MIRRPQHADHTAVCSDLGLLCVGLCHVKLSHFLPRGGVPHTGETLLSECPHPRPPGLCSVPVSFTALQSVEVGFLSVQPPMITFPVLHTIYMLKTLNCQNSCRDPRRNLLTIQSWLTKLPKQGESLTLTKPQGFSKGGHKQGPL